MSTTTTPAATRRRDEGGRAPRGRTRGRLPLIATTAAVPAEPASGVGESSAASAGASVAPSSLRTEVSPLAVVDDRDAAPGGGAGRDESGRDAGCASRSAGASPVAPPAVASASTSCPACSTRAALTPLPPARGATARHPVRGTRGQPVDVPGEVDRRIRGDGEDHGLRGARRRDRGAEQAGVVAELGGHEHRAAVEAEQRVERARERVEQGGSGAGRVRRRSRSPRGEVAASWASCGERVERRRSRRRVARRRPPAARASTSRAPATSPRMRSGSAGRSRRPRRSSRGIRGRRRRSAGPAATASGRSRRRSRRRGRAVRRGSASPRCPCR